LYDTLALLKKLVPDEYIAFLIKYYEAGLERFGCDWSYADIVTVLMAASKICQPASYLEIGVRRGRSLAAVVTQSPHVSVYAFDMWVADYAGMPNPGPEFVREEMKRLDYKHSITFVDGNSHITLPEFFRNHSDIQFELVTVDGDHGREGALQDLRDVLPHLALGGVVVFDDISHPNLTYLQDVWRKAIAEDGGILAQEYADLGYGIAVGVRHHLRSQTIRSANSPVYQLTRRFLSTVRRIKHRLDM
jgi:predicted O-methyltransferase YrrM